MPVAHLLESLSTHNPQHIFGKEIAFKLPNKPTTFAPIQRVALFTESFVPKVDGVSKSAFLTLNYLKQTGREVLVFAPDIAPTSLDNTRVVSLPSIGFPRVPETRMAFPHYRIAQELHQFKPDLIHMFSPAFMCVSGMANGRYMKLPIVANYQTDLPGYAKIYGWGFMSKFTRNWLRYIHNGCHITLVPSKHTANELKAEGFKRLRQWGRGVDNQRFDPSKRQKQWRVRLLNGRDSDLLLCIYVGRLATEKRIDLLLNVAKLPHVALTIIGDGAERDNLEKLFEGTNTHFTGYLLGNDLPAAMASADLFLFTGSNETFGQVIQEAMASGLPTICTNQGAAKDLVIQGETGFIVNDTSTAFAHAVVNLRDNASIRQEMARKARQLAQQRPWEKIMAQLETHYTEAIRINNRFNRIFGETNYYKISQIPAKLIS